jgi:NADH-quinone oxidoreductase subunit L
MLLPMTVLAIMAVVCGWEFFTGGAGKFLGEAHYYGLHPEHWHAHGFFDLFTKVGEEPMPLIALAVGAGGIVLAWMIYGVKWISAESIGRLFAPMYALLSRKYYMDELYERVFVVRILQNGINHVVELFDTFVVDGIVNGVAQVTMSAGGAIRRVETGQLQVYGLAIGLGILVIMIVFFAYG